MHRDSLEELDESVAREVFGCTQEQIEAWPFDLPAFSTDRNAAVRVAWGSGLLMNSGEL
jgi:hypothetical protein